MVAAVIVEDEREVDVAARDLIVARVVVAREVLAHDEVAAGIEFVG